MQEKKKNLNLLSNLNSPLPEKEWAVLFKNQDKISTKCTWKVQTILSWVGSDQKINPFWPMRSKNLLNSVLLDSEHSWWQSEYSQRKNSKNSKKIILLPLILKKIKIPLLIWLLINGNRDLLLSGQLLLKINFKIRYQKQLLICSELTLKYGCLPEIN